MTNSMQPNTSDAQIGIELTVQPPAGPIQSVGTTTDAATAAATTAATSGSGDAHLSTEYLLYLKALRSAWSDCPPIELVYHNLSFSIRNASTIADAKTMLSRRSRLEHTGSNYASKEEENIPNLLKSGRDILLAPIELGQSFIQLFRSTKVPIDPETILQALSPSSGIIRPGSMTLVLAPPGAGKSTFLRAITGRLDGDAGLKGDVLYNGLTTKQCQERGIYVQRLCSFIGQADISFPTLTVQETLEFARSNAVADVTKLRKNGVPNEKLESMDAQRTKLLIDLLGLTECKDTIIGNDMHRGVSGGQRRRAQLGESLLSNARIYAFDEVSNGLDSAVTLHIFNSLRQACQLDSSSVIAALQQVTPETYALFDSIILMREGRILYHGPRDQIGTWLKEVFGIPFIPDSIEEAGFLIELLSDPKAAMEKAATAYRLSTGAGGGAGGVTNGTQSTDPAVTTAPTAAPLTAPLADDSESHRVVFHLDDVPISSIDTSSSGTMSSSASSSSNNPFVLSPARLDLFEHVEDLDQHCKSSSNTFHLKRISEVNESLKLRSQHSETLMVPSKWQTYTQAQYGSKFPHSKMFHTRLCLEREYKLMTRNLPMVIPRIFSAILMGFIYGTLFWQLSSDDFSSKMGLMQSAIMFIAFANFQELPVAAEGKQVVLRQIDAGFYPAIAYSTGVNLMTVPLAVLEVFLFGIIQYYVPGLADSGDRFIFQMFILFSVSSAMSQMFRLITYASASADVAEQMAMPFNMIAVVFGGFLIARTKVRNFMIWLYYISPFSWAANSMVVNEFTYGSHYNQPDSTDPSRTLGESYIEAYGLYTTNLWKWMGVVFLWGFYALFALMIAYFLNTTKPGAPLGAKRALTQKRKSKKEGVDATHNGSIMVDINHDNKTIRSHQSKGVHLDALPFTPATLAWKDIKYTVYVGKDKTPKVLLNGISGFAEPGKLTALMGSSGAGKTTLMDVIAGRKTTGLIEHESNIFVNGRPKDSTFEHLTGYVEQTDLHIGQTTVREALEFSAHLRLPSSVDTKTRSNFVDEVMELVGLTNIQNRMVGDEVTPSLSTGQLKLLTIAVELVANPAIIFLDEPTTGLDSKSAYRVMRAIKRIAATNRTVLCTIHQPSQEVFYMFDRMLLLRSGGATVYFDELGQNGEKLVNYMTRVSNNMLPYSPLVSPANWMLDIISLDATQLIEDRKAEAAASAAASHVAKGVDGSPSSNGAPIAPVVVDPSSVEDAFRSKLLRVSKSSAHGSSPALTNLKPIQFSQEWSSSPEASQVGSKIEEYSKMSSNHHDLMTTTKMEYVSDVTRFITVLERAFVSHWRSPAINVTRLVLMIFIGIFFGLIYLEIDVRDYSSLSSYLAAIFLGCGLPGAVVAPASLATFFRQRAVFYREQAVKMYGVTTWTMTMVLVELPYHFISIILYLIPFYWMVGLSNDGNLFWKFFLVTFLGSIFFSLNDQINLAWLPNLIAAQAMNGLVVSLIFAFGGLFITAARIPVGWKWLYYINPLPKVFIGATLSQLDCSSGGIDTGSNRIDGCRHFIAPGQTESSQMYDYVAHMLDSDADAYWPMIGWLILTLAVMRGLSLILFKTISHIER